jgi:hypothetical protein
MFFSLEIIQESRRCGVTTRRSANQIDRGHASTNQVLKHEQFLCGPPIFLVVAIIALTQHQQLHLRTPEGNESNAIRDSTEYVDHWIFD